MARHRKTMNGAKDRRMFNVTARKTKTSTSVRSPCAVASGCKKESKYHET